MVPTRTCQLASGPLKQSKSSNTGTGISFDGRPFPSVDMAFPLARSDIPYNAAPFPHGDSPIPLLGNAIPHSDNAIPRYDNEKSLFFRPNLDRRNGIACFKPFP